MRHLQKGCLSHASQVEDRRNCQNPQNQTKFKAMRDWCDQFMGQKEPLLRPQMLVPPKHPANTGQKAVVEPPPENATLPCVGKCRPQSLGFEK